MLPQALLTLLFTTSALARPPTPQYPLSPPSTIQIPLILWHGLGDNYAADGIAETLQLAQKVNPGTFVYPVRLDEDSSADKKATFLGNVTEQIQYVCDDLAKHPILSTAPAVNALGFSQGGQFLRAYVERCNKPPVRNLVTFGSQHSGISSYQKCGEGDWLCKGWMGLLRGNTWGNWVQSNLVPAQYYRSLNATTLKPTDDYLEYSNFLADINNERANKNEQYKKNIAAMDNFAMYTFEEDTTVVPRESGWFADVIPEAESETEERVVVPLNMTKLYQEDWLGLRELDEKGGLLLRTHPGPHMHLQDKNLASVFKEFFGPSRKSLVDEVRQAWADSVEL